MLLGTTAAATPVVLVHQGRLLEGTDTPLNDPAVVLGFTIWNSAGAPEDAARVWPSTGLATCMTPVSKGLYGVALGAGTGPGQCGTGLTSDVFSGSEARYLEITVNGLKLTPRLQIGQVPAAATAAVADEAKKLGGLEAAAFWTKVEDVGTAKLGSTTLAATLATHATTAANTFTGDNSFATSITIGTGATATFADGTKVRSAKFEGALTGNVTGNVTGSGADLTNVGSARIGDSSSAAIADSFATTTHSHPAVQVTGLATVATSGLYADLASKPSTFPPSAHSHPSGEVTGLAAVARSGSYNDLTNKPAAIKTFSNTVTTGWPGTYTSLTQKWTRIGDMVVYTCNPIAGSITGAARGGGLSATHTALSTPSWAMPMTTTVIASPIGLNDNAPTADGSANVADGPFARTMALVVTPTGYFLGGFGSLGGQSWTVWAGPYTAVYHLMD